MPNLKIKDKAMVDELRYICTVIMKITAPGSGFLIPGFSFDAGFLQAPNRDQMAIVLENQKRFETDLEIKKALELCKNSVILFGIPTILQGRNYAEITWGEDRRGEGIRPSGITALREIRYRDTNLFRS